MVGAVGHADRREGQRGPAATLGPAQAGVGERQFDVCARARAGDQVEALEDEPDLAVA